MQCLTANVSPPRCSARRSHHKMLVMYGELGVGVFAQLAVQVKGGHQLCITINVPFLKTNGSIWSVLLCNTSDNKKLEPPPKTHEAFRAF